MRIKDERNHMSGHVTIADVANYLGISKTTVSHALSGKRQVSAELRSKVESAVEVLGYRPDFAARMMNTRSSGLVGILVDNLNNLHTMALLEAFRRELSRHSLRMVLASSDRLDDGRALLMEFSIGMVDGILNTLPVLEEREAQELAGGIPLVTYLRHREAPLEIDLAAGIRSAIAHLAELGHRRIAIISIPDHSYDLGATNPCLAAYCAEMEKLGQQLRIFHQEGNTIESGVRLAEEVFASDATAVLAGNDSIAAGLIQWANDHGIHVPGKLSIIGHDDSSMATMISPQLTTLHLPISLLAAHTVQVLMHELNPENPMPSSLKIVPELVIRKSTSSEAAKIQ